MRKESSSVSGNANQIKVMEGRIFIPHRHPYFSYTQPSSFWFHYGSPYKPQWCDCIKTGPTLRPDEGERAAYSVQEMNITQRTLSADVSQRRFVLPVSWCCFDGGTVQPKASFYRTFIFR